MWFDYAVVERSRNYRVVEIHQPGDGGEKEAGGRGAGGKGEIPLRTAPCSEAPLPLLSTVNFQLLN
jgi:hypothetical protein